MAILRAVADLLFPPTCQACRGPGAFPLCGGCLAALPLIHPPLCDRCGQPLPSGGGPPACGPCRRRAAALIRVRSAGIYAGPLREAIQALKFGGCRTMAHPLGRLMAQVLIRDPACARVDVIVPVPLHPARLRERGFNQADLLAGVVAEELGGRPVVRAVARTDATPSQVGLSADERRGNVRDAFAARRSLEGRVVLLVDDVISSGATADACAKVLRTAGAEQIFVLTAARAVLDRVVESRRPS